jgi:D-amino-acid oxidase
VLESIPDDHDTYVISRPDGTSLLGGVFFDGVWDTSVDYALAEDMFSRCAEIAPALKSPATKILGYRVGLRPGRVGGPRVEAEVINLPSKGQILSSASPVKRKQLVIHAYGLGYVLCFFCCRCKLTSTSPGGYQRSWGMAEDVRQILNDTLLNSVTLQATARL